LFISKENLSAYLGAEVYIFAPFSAGMQFQNIAKIHNAVPGRSGPLLTLGHRLHCLKVIKSINQPMTRVSNIIDLQLFTIHAVTLQHFPKAH